MQNRRHHERIRADVEEIHGKMVLARKVEIIDISLGGVALKTDRRLNVGKEYQIKLRNRGKNIDAKGVIVRCELSGIEAGDDGEGVSIYTCAMRFKEPVEFDK